MITSTDNPLVKRVRALMSKRRDRETQGVLVAEGVRLLSEAVRAGLPAELVAWTHPLDDRARAVLAGLEQGGARSVPVSPAVMAALADTTTPPGLLAVLPQPRWPVPHPLTWALALDRVRDPGNLGTMLRTAWAAGVQAVFVLPECADVFSPKVVRAAMGAHFGLPIVTVAWEALPALPWWLADVGAGRPYTAADWRAAHGLIVANEAEGPSPAARAHATQVIHIPMHPRAESLNAGVAAGILLFAAAHARQTR